MRRLRRRLRVPKIVGVVLVCVADLALVGIAARSLVGVVVAVPATASVKTVPSIRYGEG